MPKRRLTPARRAQIAIWQRAGASSTKRATTVNPFGPNIPQSFGMVRRHKLGGKGYQRKAGRVTLSPVAKQAVNGQALTAPLAAVAPSSVRGDMKQTSIGLVRVPAAVSPADLGHTFGPQSARGARKGLAPTLDSTGAVVNKPSKHPVATGSNKHPTRAINPKYLRNAKKATPNYSNKKPWGGK